MQPVTPNNFIEPYILLNNSDGCFRVPLNNIMYCNSYNSSTTFNLCNQKKIVVAKSLSYYEELLRAYAFVRIHHNTLLNIQYLCHCNKGDDNNQITLTTGEKFAVSRSKKSEVMNALWQWSIEPTLPLNDQPIQVNGKNQQDSHKPKTKKINQTH